MSFNIVYKGIRKRRARWHTRSSLIGRDRIVRWSPAQYDTVGMTRFSSITSAVQVGAGGKQEELQMSLTQRCYVRGSMGRLVLAVIKTQSRIIWEASIKE